MGKAWNIIKSVWFDFIRLSAFRMIQSKKIGKCIRKLFIFHYISLLQCEGDICNHFYREKNINDNYLFITWNTHKISDFYCHIFYHSLWSVKSKIARLLKCHRWISVMYQGEYSCMKWLTIGITESLRRWVSRVIFNNFPPVKIIQKFKINHINTEIIPKLDSWWVP